MENKTIVAIGHNENVLIFNAIGVKGVIADLNNFEDIVLGLINEDKKIIIVSQHFDELLEEVRNKHQDIYPVFITLPMDVGVENTSLEKLRRNVEKATGINLF